jgi:hypothetical protein
MAPAYYRMFECSGCGARHVVRDSFEYIGTSDPDPPPGSGWLRVIEPKMCEKRCSQPMIEIGYIYNLDRGEMTLPLGTQSTDHTGRRVKLTKVQADEWRRLIEAAGLGSGFGSRSMYPKSWWRFW